MTYKEIPGWFSFSAIYDKMVKLHGNGAHFVEIGAWFGKSASYMANSIKRSGKKIKFDVVDIWEYPGDHHYKKDKADFLKVVNKHGTFFNAFKYFMKQTEADGFYNPYKMTSVEASKMYDDESLDFVWIDANHDYQYVQEDLAHWYRKVKPGGFIGGHDYTQRWKGVIQAVDEFFGGKQNIEVHGSSWVKQKQDGEFNPSIFSLNVAEYEHKQSPKLGKRLAEILNKNKIVYDFGCGTGYYISIMEKAGFNVLGFEGTPDISKIAHTRNIKVADLAKPLEGDWPGGTCISLEVAEHIDAQYEDVFLDNITKYCDDLLILSWAVEGQKGYRHINCRNADYVLAKLKSLDFEYVPGLSDELRNIAGSELSWFKNTIYVFKKI